MPAMVSPFQGLPGNASDPRRSSVQQPLFLQRQPPQLLQPQQFLQPQIGFPQQLLSSESSTAAPWSTLQSNSQAWNVQSVGPPSTEQGGSPTGRRMTAPPLAFSTGSFICASGLVSEERQSAGPSSNEQQVQMRAAASLPNGSVIMGAASGEQQSGGVVKGGDPRIIRQASAPSVAWGSVISSSGVASERISALSAAQGSVILTSGVASGDRESKRLSSNEQQVQRSMDCVEVLDPRIVRRVTAPAVATNIREHMYVGPAELPSAGMASEVQRSAGPTLNAQQAQVSMDSLEAGEPLIVQRSAGPTLNVQQAQVSMGPLEAGEPLLFQRSAGPTLNVQQAQVSMAPLEAGEPRVVQPVAIPSGSSRSVILASGGASEDQKSAGHSTPVTPLPISPSSVVSSHVASTNASRRDANASRSLMLLVDEQQVKAPILSAEVGYPCIVQQVSAPSLARGSIVLTSGVASEEQQSAGPSLNEQQVTVPVVTEPFRIRAGSAPSSLQDPLRMQAASAFLAAQESCILASVVASNYQESEGCTSNEQPVFPVPAKPVEKHVQPIFVAQDKPPAHTQPPAESPEERTPPEEQSPYEGPSEPDPSGVVLEYVRPWADSSSAWTPLQCMQLQLPKSMVEISGTAPQSAKTTTPPALSPTLPMADPFSAVQFPEDSGRNFFPERMTKSSEEVHSSLRAMNASRRSSSTPGIPVPQVAERMTCKPTCQLKETMRMSVAPPTWHQKDLAYPSLSSCGNTPTQQQRSSKKNGLDKCRPGGMTTPSMFASSGSSIPHELHERVLLSVPQESHERLCSSVSRKYSKGATVGKAPAEILEASFGEGSSAARVGTDGMPSPPLPNGAKKQKARKEVQTQTSEMHIRDYSSSPSPVSSPSLALGSLAATMAMLSSQEASPLDAHREQANLSPGSKKTCLPEKTSSSSQWHGEENAKLRREVDRLRQLDTQLAQALELRRMVGQSCSTTSLRPTSNFERCLQATPSRRQVKKGVREFDRSLSELRTRIDGWTAELVDEGRDLSVYQERTSAAIQRRFRHGPRRRGESPVERLRVPKLAIGRSASAGALRGIRASS